MERNPYPGDVSDAEWAFVAPYLALIREDAPQREHPLREVFNGLRYIVHTGMQWRMMPNDPLHTVYPQTQRWGVRDASARPAHAVARARRAPSVADRGDYRRAHDAVDAGEW